MLRVNKRRHTALRLCLRDDLQRNGRLTRRLRAKYFDDTSTGEAANSERSVERNRSGGDHCDRNDCVFRSQPHDRSLAKLLFDLRKCQINRPAPLVSHDECFS